MTSAWREEGGTSLNPMKQFLRLAPIHACTCTYMCIVVRAQYMCLCTLCVCIRLVMLQSVYMPWDETFPHLMYIHVESMLEAEPRVSIQVLKLSLEDTYTSA